jgi:hypothetical protein
LYCTAFYIHRRVPDDKKKKKKRKREDDSDDDLGISFVFRIDQKTAHLYF